MKLAYKNIGHVINFREVQVAELVIENKKLFFDVVKSFTEQAEGSVGEAILSIGDKPVEFGKWADVTLQFAPFQLNRKSLLTKLQAALEKKAVCAENFMATNELMNKLESFLHSLAEDFPFELNCHKLAIGPIIKSISPEIEENEKSTIERIFDYMGLVRELDRERLFIMVNMRVYFADEEMECFVESARLHDFKLLLLEGTAQKNLKNTARYIIDADLCEF